MKRLPPEPTRLLDLRPLDDPAQLARMVRSAVRAPVEPAPRLKWRIRSTLRRRSANRRRYLRVVVLGGMVFLTGGVVGAVIKPIFHFRQAAKVETVEDVYPAPASPRPRYRRPVAAPELPGPADPGSPALDEPAGPPLPAGMEAAPAPAAATPPPAAPATPHAAPDQPPPRKVRPTPPRIAMVPANPSAPSAATFPVEYPALPRPSRQLDPSPPRAPSPSGTPSSGTPSSGTPSGQPAPAAPPASPASRPPVVALASVADDTPTALVPAALEPGPAPVAPPSPPMTGPGGREPVRPAPAPPATVAPPPPSEQSLLSRAVRSLRTEQRPGSALAVLDEYFARFPTGTLLPEATRLRTEALLALGHKQDALAELNREAVPGAPVREASRLVRGELAASAGRWREALVDFEAVVRAHPAPGAGASTSPRLRERIERALWGRAAARSHLGDEAGARADLLECQRRFPHGRFAAQAARLLGERP